MSEIMDVVRPIIDRLDLIAENLGVTAEKIWTFSVSAKVVQAKRDFTKGLAEFIIPVILCVVEYCLFQLRWVGDAGTVAGCFATAIIGIASIAFLWDAIETTINAKAAEHTAENDAFQELLAKLKG